MTTTGWLDRQMERAERQMAVWKEWEEGDAIKTDKPEKCAAQGGRLELLSLPSQKGEELRPRTGESAASESD